MYKTVRIPSRIYFQLLEKGGDKLISVFCTLKAQRKGKKYYSYTANNNKFVSHYSLLRQKTSLSLSVINKYVPMLIDMGFVVLEDNGNVSVIGNNKLKKLDTRNNTKLVPIKVFNKYKKTELYSYYVRIHSNEKSQKNIINKKLQRSEIIKKCPSTYIEKQNYKRVVETFGKEIGLTENVMISNAYFSEIKNPNKPISVSKGNYLKDKLCNEGILFKKRQFKRIEKMSYKQFKNRNVQKKNITYFNGYMVKELPNIISTTKIDKNVNMLIGEVTEKEKVRPLGHLQFDFIAWLANEY